MAIVFREAKGIGLVKGEVLFLWLIVRRFDQSSKENYLVLKKARLGDCWNQ
ncbi:hypothetical protein K7887_20590 [Sutcliffiella horikoshii]|uniref:hypothetical protein n=1 Tax=Sutcliffiella horikoshii TaxID=79883 RepID=UPI001CBBF308|nr:hypothetical protein [Sutcliffiella horikoshii]UAL47217.1 hypothetical protein K7887_20590 [Sutcliffiella horikoshii]